MPSVAALAQWTPVALNPGPAPTIDWGDLRGVRFSEPFFDQTVDRWAGGDPAPLVSTDLDALAALDTAPSLDPSLLIFHLSRCGSTLLSRQLATLPGTLMVAEPAPLNAVLGIDPAQIEHGAQVRLLRLMARALGRCRFADETRYVLKLSSWNIRHIALFRAAFPGVPAVWVQRAPHEVMASLLSNAAGWMRLQQRPAQARALFGLDAVAETAAGFVIEALAAMLEAAIAAAPEQVVDYRDLPEAAWQRIAPLLDGAVAPGDIDRMRAEARYDAKSRIRRPFAGDPPERQALGDTLRDIAASRLDPLYRALDRRRNQP